MEGWKSLGIGSSSCAAPNYLLSHARVFQIVYQKFGSYPEQSIALEIEHRVQMEARVYSRSAESEFRITEWVE